MPSKIACFWLEPTSLVEISLRRYRAAEAGSPCTAKRVPYPGHPPVVWGYHNASSGIERRIRAPEDEDCDHVKMPSLELQADPRWPKKCACGYEFAPTDAWQYNIHTLYLASNDYGLYTLSEAPAGAMYDATWMPTKAHDGKSLMLKTPEGDWWIDGPANNGPGWSRVGSPPYITCTPSIGIGNPYRLHGWLRGGVLEIDMP